MRNLITNTASRRKLARLRAYAEVNPVDLPRMVEHARADAIPMGDQDQRRVCTVPTGYRVAFTVEEQPCGMTRHISISVNGAFGKMPHPAVVEWIAKELGFRDPLRSFFRYIEGRDQAHPALNLIAKL
jgi:hypothetical protein